MQHAPYYFFHSLLTNFQLKAKAFLVIEMLENDEQGQKEGIVDIIWMMDYGSVAKFDKYWGEQSHLLPQWLPMKLKAAHICHANSITATCFRWLVIATSAPSIRPYFSPHKGAYSFELCYNMW